MWTYQSEKARNDLAEKVKASENEKLTFEARLAEVAEVRILCRMTYLI